MTDGRVLFSNNFLRTIHYERFMRGKKSWAVSRGHGSTIVVLWTEQNWSGETVLRQKHGVCLVATANYINILVDSISFQVCPWAEYVTYCETWTMHSLRSTPSSFLFPM